jgi:hypothetical protein
MIGSEATPSYKVEKFGSSWILLDELPFPCEIHSERFRTPLSPSNGVYRVFMNSTEPHPVCQPIQDVIQYQDRFDLILTKTPEILKACKNARLLLLGGCTVYPLEIQQKEFSVSFLCTSNRGYLLGYEHRHELWSRKGEIRIPKRFWSSRYRPVDTSCLLPDYKIEGSEKIHLFNSMFSICPENTQEVNYFTEKIMDCFWTKTVPLYWGCPNIGEYFDERGIIRYNDVNELVNICNNLTPEMYENMLPFVEENWRRSHTYCNKNIHVRLRDSIINARYGETQ